MSPEEQATSDYTQQDRDHDFLFEVLAADADEVSTKTKIELYDEIGGLLDRGLTDEEKQTVQEFLEEVLDADIPTGEKVRLREELKR